MTLEAFTFGDIAQIYREKQTLVRGLTHPAAFLSEAAASGLTPEEAETRQRQGRRRGSGGTNPFANFLSTWGAVSITAKGLYTMLRDKECIMLFPGGAAEALTSTRQVKKYRLIWNDRPEFVRVAAKFGATIIPFGGVGAEEQVTSLVGAEALKKVFPPPPERVAAQSQVQARKGVSRDAAIPDSLDSPLYVPTSVQRFYFVFGKPINVSKDISRDKDAIAAAYAEVKAGVEGSIRYALKHRERDPYRDLLRRLLYERRYNQQAPTFEP